MPINPKNVEDCHYWQWNWQVHQSKRPGIGNIPRSYDEEDYDAYNNRRKLLLLFWWREVEGDEDENNKLQLVSSTSSSFIKIPVIVFPCLCLLVNSECGVSKIDNGH